MGQLINASIYNYLPVSTLSRVIAILIALYGLYVNDVTRDYRATINPATRRRDVVKILPGQAPMRPRQRRHYHTFRERSVRSAVSPSVHGQSPPRFEVSAFRRARATAKLIFRNFSRLTRFEGLGWLREMIAGHGRAASTRERESFTARVSKPESRSQRHSTARKRRSKVYAGRVARVRAEA